MFIIFGVTQLKKKIGQVSVVCQRCKRETAHTVVKGRQWFTGFFIPLVPLGAKKLIYRCNMCGMESLGSVQQAGGQLGGGVAVRCVQCNQTFQVGPKFCPNCGQKLVETDIASTNQPALEQIALYEEKAKYESGRRKGLMLIIFGWLLAIASGIFVLGAFGAFFLPLEKDVANGTQMPIGGFIAGLIMFGSVFALSIFMIKKGRRARIE